VRNVEKMNAMKVCRIYNYISMAAMAALLQLAAMSSRAASAPSHTLDADAAVLQQAQLGRVDWDEGKRHKLRRAYWLLEHAERDYDGHRGKARKEIERAAEVMHLDLKHGEGYTGEPQQVSDERMREAKHLLEDIVDPGHAREHEHIWKAVQEINKSLALK
jgi:hypothetical protein